jgi:Rod binding domain-containing protein
MELYPTPAATHLNAKAQPANHAQMREAAEKFETFFIAQFINLMKPENTDEQFNGGNGERMFKFELNNELAKNMVQSGGFGIADSVYASLLKQQEGRE